MNRRYLLISLGIIFCSSTLTPKLLAMEKEFYKRISNEFDKRANEKEVSFLKELSRFLGGTETLARPKPRHGCKDEFDLRWDNYDRSSTKLFRNVDRKVLKLARHTFGLSGLSRKNVIQAAKWLHTARRKKRSYGQLI